MERDCNTCKHHDQARAADLNTPRCKFCIQVHRLPMWEPMEKTFRFIPETPLPTIEYPLNGGLKVPGEDFSKCGGTPAKFVLEESNKGPMITAASFAGPLRKDNPAKIGIGGAPTRATTLPEAAAERKKYPVASGVLDYFPDAIVAVSYLSFKGNEQHNPGQPLNWSRGKSNDHADTMQRHFLQRGTRDGDGVRHSVKMVWRALALLQEEIEAEHGA